jgi:hypothetical protein
MQNHIEIIDENYYGNGEFDFIKDKSTKMFLQSAYKAISVCELWNWLRIYEPPSGFMFSSAPELEQLKQEFAKDPINNNHSGASYGCMMRDMEYIAKNGYTNYKNLFCIILDLRGLQI